MRHLLAPLLLAASIAGCATPQPPVEPSPATPIDRISAFSENAAGPGRPAGWHPWILTRAKAPTQYDLVTDPVTGKVVLHAIAKRAATGLMQPLDVDPLQKPLVTWTWRLVSLVDGADPDDRHADDAPARLLLFFDGDEARLPARERMLRETARLLTGQAVPFSTLIYVWDEARALDSVLAHPLSQQIKRVVIGNGRDRLGRWKHFERNYVDDYRRAFGEDPGRLIGVGILTDTDNLGSEIEAFYGDIHLTAPAGKAPS